MDTIEERTQKPRLVINVFMELDIGNNETLRLWSGLGEKSHDGSVYHGMGDLINISPVSSSAGVQVEEVTITLAYKGSGSEGFARGALKHSIADNPFRAFLIVSDGAGGTEVEAPFFIGKVSHMAVTNDQVNLTVYTAMLDATTSKTLARLWTDDQQRFYVDRGDRAFRHVSGSSGREIAF